PWGEGDSGDRSARSAERRTTAGLCCRDPRHPGRRKSPAAVCAGKIGGLQSAATGGFHARTPPKRHRKDPQDRIAPAVTMGHLGSRGFARAAKAVNVVPETDIGIAGILVIAIARAAALGAESPGTAADHFGLALGRPSRIFARRLRVI